jgi:hypothetical protein
MPPKNASKNTDEELVERTDVALFHRQLPEILEQSTAATVFYKIKPSKESVAVIPQLHSTRTESS